MTVSYADGRIDWRRVREDRIEFAMVRAGFGDGNIDQEFERNARECNRERIPLGIYWFSYAYTREMARREAKQCVEIIRRYRVEYPVAFDFEEDSIDYAREHGVTITKDLATDFTREFCDEIRRSGYRPMFYTNLSDLEDYFDIRRLENMNFGWRNTSMFLEWMMLICGSIPIPEGSEASGAKWTWIIVLKIMKREIQRIGTACVRRQDEKKNKDPHSVYAGDGMLQNGVFF